ncbi:hypothetical protein RMSM_05845 [Rhodopirellula maiorica SM1]|uniref:Uncharacterized protein n=1 Tax=Rhodopirellula maiorica SM1 TaxID=1265738 RepID=M5RPC3_9BACT|nr:hypothetical protein [Rhodopirellula maiorica]EMI17237.1 hypothetical protein RMSM_05845 [Rhodopirellula maiorica SM1]
MKNLCLFRLNGPQQCPAGDAALSTSSLELKINHSKTATRILCILAFLLVIPSAVLAQGNANMVTQFSGTLKTAQPGVLVITRDDGTEIFVQPPDELPNLAFVAKAKPAFLGRGMLIRFSGVFDGAGNPLSKIEKVEIFQPVPPQQLKGSQRDKFTPGVYGDPHANPQQRVEPQKYDVVGIPMGITPTGILMTQAGKIPVRCPLAENVQFELRLNNLSLAQPGDPVSVSGFYQPSDETKVKAENLTITTDRVYGEPLANENPRNRRASRRNRAADAEEAPAAEADPQAEATE